MCGDKSSTLSFTITQLSRRDRHQAVALVKPLVYSLEFSVRIERLFGTRVWAANSNTLGDPSSQRMKVNVLNTKNRYNLQTRQAGD